MSFFSGQNETAWILPWEDWRRFDPAAFQDTASEKAWIQFLRESCERVDPSFPQVVSLRSGAEESHMENWSNQKPHLSST